jgi:hypothetical protein
MSNSICCFSIVYCFQNKWVHIWKWISHSLHITQYTINNKINSCTLGQVKTFGVWFLDWPGFWNTYNKLSLGFWSSGIWNLLVSWFPIKSDGIAFKFRGQAVQYELVCSGWHKFMKRVIYLQKSNATNYMKQSPSGKVSFLLTDIWLKSECEPTISL